ncbi:MAG: hypothetical protein M1816_006376 [Peltula sp. TS41687]|nr:MAG: hypothetical protein M1816_006376 [Peltula sp. TS41687]
MCTETLDHEHEREHERHANADDASDRPADVDHQTREEELASSLTEQDPQVKTESEPESRFDLEPTSISLPSPTVVEPLRLSDYGAVSRYYYHCFNVLQSAACKVIAKAWVKSIHPRKQTQNPYRGAARTKPAWWPANVLHKEPDHLVKSGRIALLMHILRLQGISISELERATDDMPIPLLQARKRLLKEIYSVALEERRLLSGAIGLSFLIAL